MEFEDRSRFTRVPLVPHTFDHIKAKNSLEWVEHSRQLVFGDNYHNHPLLHKGFVYTADELQRGPWVVIHKGDSYGSGFLNNTKNQRGESEHHPHGRVITHGLSQVLGVPIHYVNIAVGGATLDEFMPRLADYENSDQFDPSLRGLDRELLISISGNDVFNTFAGDREFSFMLKEFLEDIRNKDKLRPIPTAFFNKIPPIAQKYRRMVEGVIDSPGIEHVKRVTFSLLPNAKHLPPKEAYMENIDEVQRQVVRDVDDKYKKIVDHFYMRGSEIFNGVLLDILNDVLMENASRINFDVNVIDTHAVLGEGDFIGEHPTRAGHNKLAHHYLSRCHIEGEERSIADMLWLPNSAREQTLAA